MKQSSLIKSSDMVSGSAFSGFHKALAVSMTLGLVVWVPQAVSVWFLPPWPELVLLLFLGGSLLLGLSYILLCETSLDDEYIAETWLFSKRVRLADISKCKWIYIPGLAWLIAPRLVVQAGGLHTHVFRAADPRLRQVIERAFFGR